MRPRILIYIHYLEIGGAERALIGLLNALDPEKVDIDLFLNQHTGEFMHLIPPYVNLLPQLPAYSAIERPIRQIVTEGHIGIAARRLMAQYRYRRHIKAHPVPEGSVDEGVYLYIMREVMPALPPIAPDVTYDLALSFLQPHNIVMSKVNARRKACWIHTDYSTVYNDRAAELPVWNSYDTIASISDKAAAAFAERFPETAGKISVIENILSPDSIRDQAAMEDVSAEMPRRDGTVNILSIGRFCAAKRFEEVPRICRRLIDKGLDFKWYIVGFGNDAETRANISRYDVADRLVLLGKKANPYPYIAACDIYAQPSLYEGKSVTVREAQILCKPPVISAYPTSASQVQDGVDGIIAPLDIDGYADSLCRVIADPSRRQAITDHLRAHDHGNESEITKIYALLPD